jgi:phosphoheptose isomerase
LTSAYKQIFPLLAGGGGGRRDSVSHAARLIASHIKSGAGFGICYNAATQCDRSHFVKENEKQTKY